MEKVHITRGPFRGCYGRVVTTTADGVNVNIADGNGGTVNADIKEGNYEYCEGVNA